MSNHEDVICLQKSTDGTIRAQLKMPVSAALFCTYTAHTPAFSADCKPSGFKGTVVNRSFPSLNGGSLEITLTVPLRTIVS